MTNIIDITDYNPHIEGDALCLQCGHEWFAVAPLGTTDLECTECGTFKGAFVGKPWPEEYLECNCGSGLYFITRTELICAKCGAISEP